MKRNKRTTVVIAMYTHIEGYPPSLNAVQMVSEKFDEVVVVHRNVMNTEWVYPSNVKLVTTKEFCHYSRVGAKSFLWKAKSFLQYTMLLFNQIRKSKPDWLLLHEPVALLSWYLVSHFCRSKPKLWYHNHDLITGRENFFFYWSYKAQNRLFPRLQKFSLPSDERKEFFPMERLNGRYFFIPNFPGRYLYDRFYKARHITDPIRIVYQGFICEGHGLPEILQVIQEGIPGIANRIQLVLKGYRDPVFLDRLLQEARSMNVIDQVEVHDVTSYYNVPEVASTCHIGIGIHTKTDNTNKTLGTASNKIYEYAALGLPVILYDNAQFRKHLEEFEWAFFTDCSTSNLKKIITSIVKGYSEYSQSARRDFQDKLNFENFFLPAISDL